MTSVLMQKIRDEIEFWKEADEHSSYEPMTEHEDGFDRGSEFACRQIMEVVREYEKEEKLRQANND